MQFLHTMIRVGDLERSIDFYTQKLGMKLFRSKEYPNGQFTLAFVGFEENGPQIELTYNWDKDRYDLGTGFGHIAFGVNDIYQTCSNLKQLGVEITREPGPMKHGGSTIAFLKDPDGYMIELIQRG
ncbi:MAG: lactoylglutathione lyase [Oligoflexales bacterium]